MNRNEIKRLHSGSLVEIEFLREMFEESGIQTITRDQFSEGLHAGFPDGTPNDIDLFVFEKDFEEAYKLLQEFLKK